MADWVAPVTAYIKSFKSFLSETPDATDVAVLNGDLVHHPRLHMRVSLGCRCGDLFVHMNEGLRVLQPRTSEGPSVPAGPFELPLELRGAKTPVFLLSSVTAKLGRWLQNDLCGTKAVSPLHVFPDWLSAPDVESLVDVVWGTGQLPVNDTALHNAFPEARMAMCVSGGLRSVATGMVLFKRFLLDVYPKCKVFLLTWKDPFQGYCDDALAFVHEFLGDRLLESRYFEDDEEALRHEAVRVQATNATPGGPDSSRFPYVAQMWCRRKYCNDMRKGWTARTGEGFDYIFRCRFDGFMLRTPIVTFISASRCLASVDICMLGTSEHADIECSLGDVYPEWHAQALARGGRTWEFGSEMHVEVAFSRACIDVRKDPYFGRFGRWRRTPEYESQVPCSCPALHTVAE